MRKVGDMVHFKKDLVHGRKYSGLPYCKHMSKNGKRIVAILSASMKLNDGSYVTEAMLKPRKEVGRIIINISIVLVLTVTVLYFILIW